MRQRNSPQTNPQRITEARSGVLYAPLRIGPSGPGGVTAIRAEVLRMSQVHLQRARARLYSARGSGPEDARTVHNGRQNR